MDLQPGQEFVLPAPWSWAFDSIRIEWRFPAEADAQQIEAFNSKFEDTLAISDAHGGYLELEDFSTVEDNRLLFDAMGTTHLLPIRGFENNNRMHLTRYQMNSARRCRKALLSDGASALLDHVYMTAKVSVHNNGPCVYELSKDGGLPIPGDDGDAVILKLKGPVPQGGIPDDGSTAVNLTYSAELAPEQIESVLRAVEHGLVMSPSHIQMRIMQNGKDRRIESLLSDKLQYKAVLCNGYDELFTWRIAPKGADRAEDLTARHVIKIMRDQGDRGEPLIHVLGDRCVGVGKLPSIGEDYVWVVDQGGHPNHFLWDWPLDSPIQGNLRIRRLEKSGPSFHKHVDKHVLEGLSRYEATTHDPQSQVLLGDCYSNGDGCKKDAQQALLWYRKAAEAKHPLGLFKVGSCYLDGIGTNKNTRTARSFIHRSAELGCSQAQYLLAHWLSYGTDCKHDEKAAFQWYQKAAKQGHAHAQYCVGYSYFYAHGVPRDLKKGVDWYRIAARQGYWRAMGQLSLRYFYGNAVEEDPRAALFWGRAAAAYGDEAGLNQLGYYYLKGEATVDRDERMAVHYFKIAANLKTSAAMNNLGYCYRNGLGVEKNGKEAVKWLRMAIEHGDKGFVHKSLGLCYLEGLGVEKDEAEGERLLRMAVDFGIESARDELKKIGK